MLYRHGLMGGSTDIGSICWFVANALFPQISQNDLQPSGSWYVSLEVGSTCLMLIAFCQYDGRHVIGFQVTAVSDVCAFPDSQWRHSVRLGDGSCWWVDVMSIENDLNIFRRVRRISPCLLIQVNQQTRITLASP